jgi:phosphoribosylamine--glycine ligase
VTAVGPDLAAARDLAYEGVAAVELRGSHSRSDIARAAVEGRVTVPAAVPTGNGMPGPS